MAGDPKWLVHTHYCRLERAFDDGSESVEIKRGGEPISATVRTVRKDIAPRRS